MLHGLATKRRMSSKLESENSVKLFPSLILHKMLTAEAKEAFIATAHTLMFKSTKNSN